MIQINPVLSPESLFVCSGVDLIMIIILQPKGWNTYYEEEAARVEEGEPRGRGTKGYRCSGEPRLRVPGPIMTPGGTSLHACRTTEMKTITWALKSKHSVFSEAVRGAHQSREHSAGFHRGDRGELWSTLF